MSTVLSRGSADEVEVGTLGADVGGAACRGGGCGLDA